VHKYLHAHVYDTHTPRAHQRILTRLCIYLPLHRPDVVEAMMGSQVYVYTNIHSYACSGNCACGCEMFWEHRQGYTCRPAAESAYVRTASDTGTGGKGTRMHVCVYVFAYANMYAAINMHSHAYVHTQSRSHVHALKHRTGCACACMYAYRYYEQQI
jgi:hypothetical protein